MRILRMLQPNVVPADEGVHRPGHNELVRLPAPMTAEELAAFRSAFIDQKVTEALAEKRTKALMKGEDPDKAKVTTKQRDKIEAALPANLLEVLHADTTDLRKAGWSRPPGSKWVEYLRPADLIAVRPRVRRASGGGDTLPTVARFAVASQAPPRIVDAVRIGERVHRCLCSLSKGLTVFTGCDDRGNKLVEGHQHTHIFCEAGGGPGHIKFITLYAPMGFDRAARQALDDFRVIRGEGHDLQLVLIGVGQPTDFGGFNAQIGQSRILASGRIFRSVTPFVSTRHLKVTRAGKPKLDERGLQKGSPENDLWRLLSTAGYPEPIAVEEIPTSGFVERPIRWLEFRTIRKHGRGDRGRAPGKGFQIEFPQEVQGPLALGFGAHFGLGLFAPIESDQR